MSCLAKLPTAGSKFNHRFKVKDSVSEFNEFKPRLKYPKHCLN